MAGKEDAKSYGAAAAAAVVPPPTNVQVIAPATLEAGYAFDAMYDGVTFEVVVPEGGVMKGQRFIVPFVPTAVAGGTASSSSSSSSSDDVRGGQGCGGGGGGEVGEERRRHRRRGGGNPRGIWRDGLCDCCRFGPFHPHFLFALFLKPILMGQLLTRMKMTWLGRRTNVDDDDGYVHANLNDSRIEVNDRWRDALRNVVIVTALFLIVAAATDAAPDRDDEDDDDGDSSSSRHRHAHHDDRSYGVDDVKSAINSWSATLYGFYLTYVIIQLRATIRHVYSIPEDSCLCLYKLGLFGNDPREGVCGTGGGCCCDDDPGWCTSGVPVGWEDICCAIWCQFCILGQMARHTVDYGERKAVCCNAVGVSDWDDDEAYEGVESGHVGEGSVLVV
ncbi:hypothetical protein ACHAW5_004848 [Stephanodiscus triporus]|uniref:Uncharacterized protein n=1 Tax=Stephanodiscus triporus TaxID=2934178 RepID=A0ABD3MHX7_9STRA